MASELVHALFTAEDSAPGFTPAQRAHQHEVAGERTVIGALDRRLRSSEAVAPRGMAMLHMLLADAASPLLRPSEPGALGSRLRAAAAALQPGVDPASAAEVAHRLVV